MEEKKNTTAPETEVQNEELKEVAGGFFDFFTVPTVPTNPIDNELRNDV